MTNLIALLFIKKLNLLNPKAARITGAIQGTSPKKLLDKLGLETLKSWTWLKKLCCMYKIINIGIPKYFTDLIPEREIGYNIRKGNKPFF